MTWAAELRRAAAAAAPRRADEEPALPDVPAVADPERPRRWPFVLGAAVVLPVVAAVLLRGGAVPARMVEVEILTDPPDLPVLLDGRPLVEGRVAFPEKGPYGTLTVEHGCRRLRHVVSPDDAPGPLVLALEPTQVVIPTDAGVAGARVALDGRDAGRAPLDLRLDLCRETRVEVRAEGYRPLVATIAAGATADEARRLVGGLALVAIPRGAIAIPKAPYPLTVTLDGGRVTEVGTAVEVEEGRHVLRAVSADLFVEVFAEVEVRGGETVAPDLGLPALATVAIQAFPPNGKAYMRRPGEEWRLLDDIPVRKRVAEGRYEIRVVQDGTGVSRERVVSLRPGDNPPVRFSFGRGNS